MTTQEKSTTRTAAKSTASVAFSADERAAMKEHAQDLKTAARRGARTTSEDGEKDVLARIAEMSDADRVMAEWIHTIVKRSAPSLLPKLWYGMPAYAKDGKVVCFFQSAAKFKARYATLGFNDSARLDDGDLWPTAFALAEMTPAAEARIGDILARSVS